ncbi:MAG: rod shape-determining protein MreC [Proteobacteria bacterium]|nr:rod shape-determining protein MreC [Pseudomonadota bacterium]MDA0862126.1 rod shape-determining protein MreC [Pseudomonadota bacterium]MDA1030166.1 rod shape-determining protein MreC [Pseudomonadota bacterium]
MPLASNTIKGNKFHFYVKFLVYLTIALCLIFLDLNQRTFTPIKDKLSSFEVAVNGSFRPFKAWLDDFSIYFSSKVELVRENQKLKTAQIYSDAQLQRLAATEKRLEELESLLELREQGATGMHAVTVIAASDSPYDQWLRVQYKKNVPIKSGDYVVGAKGLIGQVISVEEDQAVVRVVSDQRASVYVQVLRTGFRAVVFGRGKYNSLELKFVPEEVDIKADDILVTSGLGGRYPYGIPVGKVSSVSTDLTSTFSRILVQSLEDPNANNSFIALTGSTDDDLFSLDKSD